MLREVGSGLEDSDDLPDADREAPGNAAADAIAGRVAQLTPGQLDCLRLVDQHLSSKEIAAELGISPQVQDSLVAAALDQIASVPSNGFEPRIIEKLGGAGGARPLVLCIRVTVGLGYDNALD